eukprot:9067048-Alexandrium_andersonii.AAC.1
MSSAEGVRSRPQGDSAIVARPAHRLNQHARAVKTTADRSDSLSAEVEKGPKLHMEEAAAPGRPAGRGEC